MEKKKFCFTNPQRGLLIGAAFKKNPADVVGVFLDRCETAITKWQNDWWRVKTPAFSKRERRDGLHKVLANLQRLRCSILLLPDGTAEAVLVNWNMIKDQPMGDCKKAQIDIDSFIIDLQGAIHRVQEDIPSGGGISKERESELISELADVYAWTFRKLPSASPIGIFMRFIDELKNVNAIRPDGKSFIAGKDLVASSLKPKAKLRNCYLLYPVD